MLTAVWKLIEAVKDSGLTKMLNRPAVIELAEYFEFHKAARWIEAHRNKYAERLFRGFMVEPEGGK